MPRVSSSPSRYRQDAASDYRHRFHAGNVGDVWKHCVLVEVLRRTAAAHDGIVYVESHAGEGCYVLGPTGEWTEGIGRLWGADGVPVADDAVGRYLRLARALASGEARPDRYPGSPLLARAALPETATLALWEADAASCERLATALAPNEPRVAITCGDGLGPLSEAVAAAEARGAGVVALVDPPFTRKSDWLAVPDAVIAAAAASARATLLLWYPLKSLTRPNAMIARFKAAGVAASVAELVTTPLEHQRSRLNGSGLVLVRPPDGALAAIAAAAPILGARLATRPGAWSLRLASW